MSKFVFPVDKDVTFVLATDDEMEDAVFALPRYRSMKLVSLSVVVVIKFRRRNWAGELVLVSVVVVIKFRKVVMFGGGGGWGWGWG